MSLLKLILKGYVIPLVFVIAGVVVVYQGVRNYYNASSSISWPGTDGVVVKSSVSQESDSDGTTYRAEVLYEYKLDGVLHSANVVSFGDYGASWPSHAREIVNRYPDGKGVTVYYDPSDHNNAVLEPGTSFTVYIVPVFGSVFVVIGVLLLLYLPNAVRNAQ